MQLYFLLINLKLLSQKKKERHEKCPNITLFLSGHYPNQMNGTHGMSIDVHEANKTSDVKSKKFRIFIVS